MKLKRILPLPAALHLFSLLMLATGQTQIPASTLTKPGENWVWQKAGDVPGLNNISGMLIDPQDDNIWYVVSIDSGLYVTRDGGAHWVHAIKGRGLDAEGLQIDPANPNIVYAAVWDKLYKSQDRGISWSIVYTCPEYIRSVLVSKIDGGIYLGPQTETSSTPGIYKSVDGGLHFILHPFGVGTPHMICWDIVEDAGNNILYVPVELADHPQPYNPPLFRSLDGGASWQNIAFTNWHAQKMGIDERNGAVYFLVEGGSLYRSGDRGVNWKLLNNQQLFYFMIDPKHPGRMFGAASHEQGPRGAWMSENSGRAFAPLGLDDLRVTAAAINGDGSRLFASTWGDGLWTAEAPEYVPFSGIRVAAAKDAGLWSLREAINLANRGVGADTIRFDIPRDDPGYAPSAGTWTILLDSDLPTISDDSLFIDGHSQRVNDGEDTNAAGPEIVLTTNAANVSGGLTISSAYNRISHLVVNAMPGSGINISGQSARHNVVVGCYLGTDASGEISLANQFGVNINDAGDNRIGSRDVADRNIISGNAIQGIVLSGANCTNNLIVGNDIGLTAKKQNIGNNGSGVFIGAGAALNMITENEIAFNSSSGIAVFDAETGRNTFSKNSIHNNVNRGIFLFNDANSGIQPPVLSLEGSKITGRTVAGATIELFSDGDSQGEVFEGAVMADASGRFTWTGKAQGPFVTATTTDAAGNTSAFSNAIAPPADGDVTLFVVTTTNETGPGSITEAVAAAQATGGRKRIEFHIPKSDAGFDAGVGAWTIKTYSSIVINTDSLTIDGRSQSAFIGEDSNPDGPEIMFSGEAMGTKSECFVARTLKGFNMYGLVISLYATAVNLTDVDGGEIAGCYFGADPSGTDSLGNAGYGLYVANSSRIKIGAPEPGSGNLLWGSLYADIYLTGCDDIFVVGNIVGLDRTKESFSSSYYGPIVVQASNNIEVSGNTIGGDNVGLTSWFSAQLLVRDNYFNISRSWEKIGAQDVGVWLSDSSHDNRVADNKIGFCQLYAIGIQEGAVRNRLSRNLLSGNKLTGINLSTNTNNNIAAPTLLVASADKVEGQAGAGHIIEVFNDEDGQAREYLGVTTADASGFFSLVLQTTPNLAYVTATATDADSNTSALSAPLKISPTGVADEVAGTASDYYLARNYPNPFNPNTTIRFGLQKSGLVDLRVYNLRGEQAAVLLHKEMPAGDHRVDFDGASLPSGVYLVRLRVNDFERMQKIMLLR